jgi:hypothetical protein
LNGNGPFTIPTFWQLYALGVSFHFNKIAYVPRNSMCGREGLTMPTPEKVSQSKYTADKMLPALRHFIEARAKALPHSYITDNGGAI